MTINCKGTLVDLTKPKVMGILNVTPDSFFDGGRYADENKILERVAGMLEDGATFIDLGAYSSRPGADFVSEAQELERIVPIVELLVRNFPEILLSIDTFRSNVAKETISAGGSYNKRYSCGRFRFRNDESGWSTQSALYYDAYERKSQYYATTCLVFRFDTGGIRIFFS